MVFLYKILKSVVNIKNFQIKVYRRCFSIIKTFTTENFFNFFSFFLKLTNDEGRKIKNSRLGGTKRFFSDKFSKLLHFSDEKRGIIYDIDTHPSRITIIHDLFKYPCT